MTSPPLPPQFENLHDGWNVINDLYKDSTNCSLQELLEKVLSHIQSLNWLNIEPRGTILLKSSSKELILSAHYGLTEERAAFCERVSLDRCACGRVIHNKTLSFTSCNGGYGVGQTSPESEQNHFILPLNDQDTVLGVVTLFVPLGHHPDATEMAMMHKLADTLSAIISRLQMKEILAVKELELKESKVASIHQLGKASEYRDNETGMHVLRMSHYAGAIAKALGIPNENREILTVAAPMHDVGKIGIRDSILLKPGKLTDEEFEEMKNHVLIGSQILKGNDELMQAARDIAISHHEKWDGSGYPKGTKGEETSLYGRICCLADVFDALTSERPYKKAWPLEKALKTIKKDSGYAFDPKLVSAFLEALPEILRIKNLFRDEIIDPTEKLFLPALPVHDDDWIPWDDDFVVGIDAIDDHHRYLFSLTNTLYKTISQKQQASKIASVLNALRQYTIVHFREEERMMRRYNFSHMETQVTQHRFFVQKLDEFREVFLKSPLTLGFEMAYYLRDWLINHIQEEDKKLAILC